jgi:predicted restriction endonuclease
MNSLDRTSLKKAGYDNGWEIANDNPADCIKLSSSRHPYTVDINSGPAEKEWSLRFSENTALEELKRNLPKEIFTSKGIVCYNREILAVVLRRAAELGRSLPEIPVHKYEKAIADFLNNNTDIRDTEKEQTEKERIGQDIYRKALLEYWKSTCAVTAITIPQVLKASHAKPWKDCTTNAERLNVYNGFLLSANLDSLFDSGLISFEDNGNIIFSKILPKSQIANLGLSPKSRLQWVDKRHIPFLEWHRDKIFQGQQ